MTKIIKKSVQSLAWRKVPKGYPHISEDDVLRMINACYQEHHRLMIELLWRTGLRISELLSLRVRDFDFAQRIVTGRRNKKRPGQNAWFKLRLPDFVSDRIKSYCRGKRPYENLIPMSRYSAYKILQQIATRAAIELKGVDPQEVARAKKGKSNRRGLHFGPHVFRHSRVYHLIRQGCSATEVAEFLGHEDYSTIMNYFHLQLEDTERLLAL